MEEKVTELKKENTFLKGRLDHSEEEVKRLKNIIKQFQKNTFGSKSERFEEQLLFNEVEVEYKDSPQLPLVQEQITYTRKKGKGKRKAFQISNGHTFGSKAASWV